MQDFGVRAERVSNMVARLTASKLLAGLGVIMVVQTVLVVNLAGGRSGLVDRGTRFPNVLRRSESFQDLHTRAQDTPLAELKSPRDAHVSKHTTEPLSRRHLHRIAATTGCLPSSHTA